jgi:hypothetical protein
MTAAPIYGVRFDAPSDRLIWFARATVQVMQLPGGQLGAQLNHEDSVSPWRFRPAAASWRSRRGQRRTVSSRRCFSFGTHQRGAPGTAVLDEPAYGGHGLFGGWAPVGAQRG